ncbi:hypothetical protein OPQ81_002627 [Rhizoctonia solani]|nr:hypothetical protein OPQ81_002627 [Rhizoctonia solani]
MLIENTRRTLLQNITSPTHPDPKAILCLEIRIRMPPQHIRFEEHTGRGVLTVLNSQKLTDDWNFFFEILPL